MSRGWANQGTKATNMTSSLEQTSNYKQINEEVKGSLIQPKQPTEPGTCSTSAGLSRLIITHFLLQSLRLFFVQALLCFHQILDEHPAFLQKWITLLLLQQMPLTDLLDCPLKMLRRTNFIPLASRAFVIVRPLTLELFGCTFVFLIRPPYQ